jgi:hypothetical protein
MFGTVRDLTQEHLAATVTPRAHVLQMILALATGGRHLKKTDASVSVPSHLRGLELSTWGYEASNVLELFHSRIALRSANTASCRTVVYSIRVFDM